MPPGTLKRKKIKRNDTSSIAVRELEQIARKASRQNGTFPNNPIRLVEDSACQFPQGSFRLSKTAQLLPKRKGQEFTPLLAEMTGSEFNLTASAIGACMEFLKASRVNDTARAIDWVQIFECLRKDEPEADFYEPVQYNWSEDKFIARQAAKEYSAHTNADS